MKKRLLPSLYNRGLSFIMLFFISLFITSCGFRKAVRLYNKGEINEAAERFPKYVDHDTYGPGAEYYLQRIKAKKEPTTTAWLEVSQAFCEIEDKINYLPVKAIKKLKKYDADRSDVIRARDVLQDNIFDRMSLYGRVVELIKLDSNSGCWSLSAIDSLQKIVVNKTINPEVQVFDNSNDLKWIGRPIILADYDTIRANAGRSCVGLSSGEKWKVTYDEVNQISKRYAEQILPQNYSKFWEYRSNIWSIFQIHEPYCKMDEFQKDNPFHYILKDCWYEKAIDTLCMGQLKPLLAYHKNNPHTVLDNDICFQIMCLSGYASDLNNLTKEEAEHLMDVRMMFKIQSHVMACDPQFEDHEVIPNLVYLAEKYPGHKMVFDLSIEVLNYFSSKQEYETALEGLNAFRPLFPDASVCSSDYYFQVKKQEEFNAFEILLDRARIERVTPNAAISWNTTTHDEYGLVSWGDTHEVFFVRKNPGNGAAKVMKSYLLNDVWSTPEVVERLSISNDVVPLSMSADGEMILLKAGGNLLRVTRRDIGKNWGTPEVLPLIDPFAGHAWISPDDSLLLVDYYASKPTPKARPRKDIGVAKLDDNDNYGKVVSISKDLNQYLYDENKPVMALGGRMLLFTSDRKGSIGGNDLHSIALSEPYNWDTFAEAKNIGLPVNTTFEDYGITFLSDYSGLAYYDKYDVCNGTMDIWQVKLADGLFPKAIRLTGLIIDENDRPIGGGFMEFTPNFQLNVHSQIISNRGTYNYTVKENTEVVRLFPEIPGYFSERDTTHFLANISKGEIIRDTFRLLSFDYIRRSFELIHSTFEYGQTAFNDSLVFPELVRLSRIANRMGAELTLRGHTDGRGTEAGNVQLSLERAKKVKEFLVEVYGFEEENIHVFGLGSSEPKCPNDTEEGRRCNRRIEIIFRMPDLPSKPLKITLSDK